MYKHLLIATDGSSVGQKAVDHGLALAKTVGAKVTVVTVTEMWSAFDMAGQGLAKIETYEAAAAQSANKILAAVSSAANAAGVACETVHVKDSAPAAGIVAEAERLGCDVIVMGSHGRRGLNRLLIGSHANEVVTHAKIPVLVCR